MRHCWLVVLGMVFAGALYAQPGAKARIAFNPHDYDLRGKTGSPALLVSELTKGKTGDKEKFDALFGWVASTVSYDYRAYYSSNGSGLPDVKKILKHKRGICVDYAFLMDTLCSLAGIPNVTIYGYAKDELFDLYDSIYVDNHAWNAVRLNGLWYLYDVTWANGEYNYTYTRWSRFILRLQEKVKPKFRARQIRRDKRIVYSTDCPGEGREPAYYFEQRFLNRVLHNFLYRFKLRIKGIYREGLNTNYYLGDPEVFGITHFPDDPVWSLLPGKSMRDFETDSAFYYLEDSILKRQEVTGAPCPACDSSLAFSTLQKYSTLAIRSAASNPRNSFVTALCGYMVGDLRYRQGVSESDSLAKLGLLDSAQLHFQQGLSDLKQCRRNIKADFVQQKQKNKRKQSLLVEDNKRHTRYIRSLVFITRAEARNSRELLNKICAAAQKQRSRRQAIRAISTELVYKKGKWSGERMAKLRAENGRAGFLEDSVSALLGAKQRALDSISEFLSLNVWQKAMSHDELIGPFRQSTYYRTLLLDNYKKPVVETRRLINSYEARYGVALQQLLYGPSARCALLGSEIVKLLSLRDNFSKEHLRKLTELVKKGEEPSQALSEYRKKLIALNRDSYCWLENKVPVLISNYMGFDFLVFQQRSVERVIDAENGKERQRLYVIEKELKRRKSKYSTIVSHNSHLLLLSVKKAKRARRNFTRGSL